MHWDIECTDEFVEWYQALSYSERESISFVVKLLEEKGVQLGYSNIPLNLYYSLWSAIRIIAQDGAIILIALQREMVQLWENITISL